MVLATAPKLMLLDEPTAGMSPEETARMTRMLEGLPREVTLLIIEHDMDVVGSLADRVTVLHYGEVLTEGTFDEVKRDPRVYEVYLGAARDARRRRASRPTTARATSCTACRSAWARARPWRSSDETAPARPR